MIGVHPHERVSRQRLLISVELETDISRPAASDRIEDALDYTAIAAAIERCAESGRYHLIETLAERLAVELMQETVSAITVEVQKPGALTGTREVGVRVKHSRQKDG